MEHDFSSDEETEQLPDELQSDHSESEPPSSENEDGEDEYMSEQEENGEEVETGKDGDLEHGDLEQDKEDIGGEEGAEGDAEGEEGEQELLEESNEKPKKKMLKRKKSKVKGDSAQPKKKRKGKEPLAKKKRRPSKPKNLRRDIKTLIKETELDKQTVTAQREEEERKKRLEEQRAQNVSPPALLTQLLETKTSDLLAEQRRRIIADTNEYILLESSSGEEDKKQTIVESIKTKPELIEILSSDEDVKVLSESEKEEQSDAEFSGGALPGHQEESGTHTDDTKNRPDEDGRVLVNVAHPLDEQDIYLPQHLAGKVKAHQIGGVRFLYDNLVESLNRFSNSPGFGCILAHSMGLGKTLQVICFSDIFLRYTNAWSVLIIVPINTLQNWIAEFDMWLPQEGDPSTGRQGRQFNLYVLNDTHKTTMARAKVICDWYQNGGVMLMGYELYRLLCNRRFTGKPKRRKKKKSAGPEVIDLEEEERMEKELENIRHAICNPGPDLVICDEGHRIKNSLAGISKALKNIKTRRRVVLTGYPLQNNLMEYWCMVDFVRPNYLGTKHEFSNLFERPIQNGQCIDSTPADIKFMRYRAHILHNKLEGFVQRRGFQVLKLSLPDKHEHIIMVRLTPFQKGLYCKFMHCFKDAGAGGWCSTNPLKAFSVGCKIWNHPDILFDVLQKNESDVDTDLDIPDLASKLGPKKQTNAPLGSMTSGSGSPTCLAEDAQRANGITAFEEKLENMSYQEKVNQILSFEWARDNMRNYTSSKVSNGGKMVLLFHIIEESIKLGDKILVFTQSLMTLSLIEKFLSLRSIPDPPNKEPDMCKDWIKNVTYFRLDGSTAGTERERMINQFNKPTNQAWLFLLSTRAGCLGVNLIGANRVVVLDASWNPCHDAQAVCRVYRYGQKKTCHIYRMVTDNTLEKKIYDRQISKKGMSDRVVDELNPQMNLTKREVESLLDFDDSDMPFEDFGHVSDTFEDPVLQTICRDHSQVLCKAPFSTESLLWDRKDQRLTRAEKLQAKKSYEDEVRLNTNYSRPSYTGYYPKSENYTGSATPAAPGGFDTSLPYLLNMRGQIQMPKRPVASVRPLQSTPVPKYPPAPGLGLTKPQTDTPLETLKGLSVQKIVATTDILLPGINTLSNTTTKINAGETVTFIKTHRGLYLRTPEGRFIAVRAPNTKDSSHMSLQRPNLFNSKGGDTLNLDRDSPHSSSETGDLSSFSTSQLSSSNSNSSFIPQLTETSFEIGSGIASTMSTNSLSSSAISTTSTNQLNSVASSPFMFPPSFMQPNQSGPYFPHQSSLSFSPSGTPPPSSMTTLTSDLANFFSSPQGLVSNSDIVPQDMSLPQSNIMDLSVSDMVPQASMLPQADILPVATGTDVPHTSTITHSDCLTQEAIEAQANMIPSGSGYSVDSPSGSVPSIPIPEVATSSGGYQESRSLEFLSVPPQLPTLDANSVEQILMSGSTSSESERNSSTESSTSVQSSNLASLSEFVSSTFQ